MKETDLMKRTAEENPARQAGKLCTARRALLLIVLLAALSLPLVACGQKAKLSRVGILQLVEHPALDAAREGIIEGLKAGGFEDGKNISVDIQNAQGDSSNVKAIADRFVSNKMDLIFCIATPAAQTMAATSKTIPILGTAITDYEIAKLVASNDKPGGNVSGTTDMNPVREQVALLRAIAPTAKSLGIIYSSNEINSELQAKIAEEEALRLGLEVKIATISNINDLQQTAGSLVKDVDAVYVPTDNAIASAIPILGEACRSAKIPLICGEGNQVRGGGLITLGVDYKALGLQTGQMAVKLLKGEAKIAEMPIEAQKEFPLIFNKTVGEAIGISLPDDLAGNAEIVE